MSRFVVLFSLLFSFSLHAWPPSEILPQVSSPNTLSPEAWEIARMLHEKLSNGLQYWSDRGMPKPRALKGFIYIDSYENITLEQLIKTMNPEIKDVQAHVEEQYQYFKKTDLFMLLHRMELKTNHSTGFYTDAFFDGYALGRFGFEVHNFRKHLKAQTPLARLARRNDFRINNASFATSEQVDITEVLKLESSKKELIDWTGDFLKDAPLRLMWLRLIPRSKRYQRNRWVMAYPRHSKTTDFALSSLNDPGVFRHELGHHLINSLVEEAMLQSVGDELDEAGADYIAASESDDPVVAKFFATSQLEVARLSMKTARTAGEMVQAYRLFEIAQKGAVRDMRAWYSTDELQRRYVMGDEYKNGHPMRGFLWALRQHQGAEIVDQLFVKTLLEMGNLPGRITTEAVREISLREKALADRQEAIWKELRKEITEEENPKSKALMTQIAEERLAFEDRCQEMEKEARIVRMKLVEEGGVPFRPLVAGDYFLPEFIRAFYRVARRENLPEVAFAVQALGGMLMNSKAVEVKIEGEPSELVFFRRPEVVADPQVQQKLVELFRARHKIHEKLLEFHKLPHLVSQKTTEPMVKEYDDGLNKLIAFERSGRPWRLDDPRLHADWIKRIYDARNGIPPKPKRGCKRQFQDVRAGSSPALQAASARP